MYRILIALFTYLGILPPSASRQKIASIHPKWMPSNFPDQFGKRSRCALLKDWYTYTNRPFSLGGAEIHTYLRYIVVLLHVGTCADWHGPSPCPVGVHILGVRLGDVFPPPHTTKATYLLLTSKRLNVDRSGVKEGLYYYYYYYTTDLFLYPSIPEMDEEEKGSFNYWSR